MKARPLEGTVSITRTASRGAAVFFNREVDSCSLDGGGKTEVGRGYQKQTFAEAPLARRSYEVAARSPAPSARNARRWGSSGTGAESEPPSRQSLRAADLPAARNPRLAGSTGQA